MRKLLDFVTERNQLEPIDEKIVAYEKIIDNPESTREKLAEAHDWMRINPEVVEQRIERVNRQNEQLKTEELKEAELEKQRLILGKCFEDIKAVYSGYIDLKEDYKTMIALWIIGTYMHDSFECFPFLFFNAMRGSGKTRTLKLTTILSWEGQLLASLTESVLFRSKGTLGVDEFEDVGDKSKQALRELLNAGYKKGIKVRRMKKVSKKNELGLKEESQEAEEFEAYRPVVMANIWGMEEVLNDRCITIPLEKSGSLRHTKKIEDFTSNPQIKAIKEVLANFSVVKCSVYHPQKAYMDWNNYIDNKYKDTTLHYTTTLTTTNYTSLHSEEIMKEEMFNKIDQTNIDGRHLELYMPFFYIAKLLSDDLFNEVLRIAKNQVEDKRIDDIMESQDVMFFDYISRNYEMGSWIAIKQLTEDFRTFIGEEHDKKDDWLNTRWVGRALKRLCLIIQKRRLGRGMDVIINKSKAEDKMKMFFH